MTQATTFGRVFYIDSSVAGRYATLGDDPEQIAGEFQRGFQTDEVPTVVPGDWDAVAEVAERGIGPVVDTVEWEPYVPTEANSGGYTYLRVKRRKTLREVSDELLAYLGGEHEYSVESPISPYVGAGVEEWPQGRTVVFSVRGGSEGDWIHVEVQDGDDSKLLLLAKTFGGREDSWRDAKRIADLLGV